MRTINGRNLIRRKKSRFSGDRRVVNYGAPSRGVWGSLNIRIKFGVIWLNGRNIFIRPKSFGSMGCARTVIPKRALEDDTSQVAKAVDERSAWRKLHGGRV